MGNIATKQEPLPDVIRQADMAKHECSICFELKRKGVLCATKEHFICHDCFPPYVDSVIGDAGKLMDSDFTIKCCQPGCVAPPWTSHEIRLALDGTMLEKYMDSMVRCLQLLNGTKLSASEKLDALDIDEGVRKIADSLTLGCPFCHIALDPSPDGCAAMRCGTCSKHFCHLCMKIQRNSKDCHSHVTQCPQNPSHDLFVSNHIKDAAHKLLRLETVRGVLSAIYGKDWRNHPHTDVLLEGAGVILAELSIGKKEVLAVGGERTDKVVNNDDQSISFCSGFLLAWCLALVYIWWNGNGSNNGHGSNGIGEGRNCMVEEDAHVQSHLEDGGNLNHSYFSGLDLMASVLLRCCLVCAFAVILVTYYSDRYTRLNLSPEQKRLIVLGITLLGGTSMGNMLFSTIYSVFYLLAKFLSIFLLFLIGILLVCFYVP